MDLNKVSRFLSLILRHHPEKIGITLDKHGWASVAELLSNWYVKNVSYRHGYSGKNR